MQSVRNDKSLILIFLTLVSWLFISVLSWRLFWVTAPVKYGLPFWILLQSLHAWWMLFWLWGIHNFWHQIFSCFSRERLKFANSSTDNPFVVILYTTCDDFDAEACQSCLEQNYPNVRVIICDDSKDESNQALIDRWVGKRQKRITVVRRKNHIGFKAGNLNHAIAKCVDEEFILLCDADEIIPPDFVKSLLAYFYDERVGFVQAEHTSHHRPKTRFAAILGLNISIFYRYCLPSRNKFGFVPCLGHGVMIRRRVWKLIGGFPDIVAEDIGFASRALVAGFRGVFTKKVSAQEAFPSTYKALKSKYSRIIRGTIEYFQKEYLPVVKSSEPTWTEKIDILLTFSTCYIGLVTMINLIGGLLLFYLYRLEGCDRLASWLLAVYLVGPLTPIIPLIVNLPQHPIVCAKFFLGATMAYVGLLPVLAINGVKQTLRLCKLTFEATGNVGQQPQCAYEFAEVFSCGVIVLIMANVFKSPSYPATVCVALMFLLAPLLSLTERKGPIGVLARYCGIVPYLVLVYFLFYSYVDSILRSIVC